MIEIEVDRRDDDALAAKQDFFTFYGDVPPCGAELQVGHACNVKGDWVDYKCLGAGIKWELDDACAYHIEAEDLELHGYKVQDNKNASGKELIKLTGHEGSAKVKFGGESGTYDLSITFLE